MEYVEEPYRPERKYFLDPFELQAMFPEGTHRLPYVSDISWYDRGEVIGEYLNSERFDGLTGREKALAHRALSVCGEKSEWHVGFQTVDDGLFKGVVPRERVRTHDTDELVLSGVLGAHVIDTLHEHEDPLADTLDNGQLETLVTIGAAIHNEHSIRSAGATFTIREGEAERQISVGADFHGDFSMFEVRGMHSGSVAPNGMQVSFSPAEKTSVAAYHSVEIDIVECCLEHMAAEMDKGARIKLHDAILSTQILKLQEGTNAFGDYGSNLKYRSIAHSREWERRRDGSVMESLLVTPGNFETKFEIESMPSGMNFVNVRYANEQRKLLRKVYIPDTHIPDFIATVAMSNMGRVSPAEIRTIVDKLIEN